MNPFLRRRAMMEISKSQEWDVCIIDPTDGYGAVRIDVNAGDTYYVEWDINATTGYVYDMRRCGGSYMSMNYSGNDAKIGEKTIVIPEDGYIVFGYKYSYTETGNINFNDRFNGEYIRAKKM